MKILVTGNMGYIGAQLSTFFSNSDSDIEMYGLDTGFFSHCLSCSERLPETSIRAQFFEDVRDLQSLPLSDFDCVVHLAAISNDPMGNQFAQVTNDINFDASVHLARLASRSGVKNFVFASSCSMYGSASDLPKTENDSTNPLTAYAQSKIKTENILKTEDHGDMIITSLRFATACGWSSRLRLDLVLNDFVASAISTGSISILSNGSPWRPLIDVEDMCRAIFWASTRNADNGGNFCAVNVGHNESNYQVIDIAKSVANSFENVTLNINDSAPSDDRSYKVDFSLYAKLAPQYIPRISLDESISRLIHGLSLMNFNDPLFRESPFMRLNCLRNHLSHGRISPDLRWN